MTVKALILAAMSVLKAARYRAYTGLSWSCLGLAWVGLRLGSIDNIDPLWAVPFRGRRSLG